MSANLTLGSHERAAPLGARPRARPPGPGEFRRPGHRRQPDHQPRSDRPRFTTLWNVFQSPGFVNATVPFSLSSATSLSAQMLHRRSQHALRRRHLPADPADRAVGGVENRSQRPGTAVVRPTATSLVRPEGGRAISRGVVLDGPLGRVWPQPPRITPNRCEKPANLGSPRPPTGMLNGGTDDGEIGSRYSRSGFSSSGLSGPRFDHTRCFRKLASAARFRVDPPEITGSFAADGSSTG